MMFGVFENCASEGSSAPLDSRKVIVYRFTSKSLPLVFVLITTLACPWPVALPAGESILVGDPQSNPSILAARSFGTSVTEMSIERVSPPMLINDRALFADDQEEDDGRDDFAGASVSVPMHSFAPFSIRSPRLALTALVEPRSPKVPAVIRFCRFRC